MGVEHTSASTSTLVPVPRNGLRATRLPAGGVVLSYCIDLDTRVLRERLTATQFAVVIAMLDGLSNEAIAKGRSCSVNTVSAQLRAAFARCGVNSRSELAAFVALESTTSSPW